MWALAKLFSVSPWERVARRWRRTPMRLRRGSSCAPCPTRSPPACRGYRYVVASNRVLLVGSRIVVGVFADANARRAKDAGRLRVDQGRLKPALRLFEMSRVGVSLTEPVTLNGPPNSFCSALSVRSHLSSMLEMSAPTDTLVSVGRMLKRSAWLVAQLCTCPVAFG